MFCNTWINKLYKKCIKTSKVTSNDESTFIIYVYILLWTFQIRFQLFTEKYAYVGHRLKRAGSLNHIKWKADNILMHLKMGLYSTMGFIIFTKSNGLIAFWWVFKNTFVIWLNDNFFICKKYFKHKISYTRVLRILYFLLFCI